MVKADGLQPDDVDGFVAFKVANREIYCETLGSILEIHQWRHFLLKTKPLIVGKRLGRQCCIVSTCMVVPFVTLWLMFSEHGNIIVCWYDHQYLNGWASQQ